MNTNRELSRIFNEMATMLEMDEVAWKPRAYKTAAESISALDEDIRDIYEKEGKNGIRSIAGIGYSISDHVIEYLKTGTIKHFDQLRRKYPESLTVLANLPSLGPHRVKALLENLGVRSEEDLQAAVKARKVQKIPVFGPKLEEDIAEALHGGVHARLRLDEALPIAEEIVAYLHANAPMRHLYYVGSLRRSKETAGDIDMIAVSSNAERAMDVFIGMPMVEKVIARGETKSAVVLREKHIQVDLRIIPMEAYAAALVYFTGNRDHNIALRNVAIKKGYKLSEYGLFKGASKKPLHLETEEALYRKLGFAYIEPELRENRGELEAAKKGKLPKLVTKHDIKGDLHIHSRFSDGQAPIAHMVKAAEKLGYEYIAITDHSPSLKIARGLTERRLTEQWEEIEMMARKSKIKILKGAEVDILPDGSLDYPEKVLKKLDIVIGSIHSHFKMDREEMTARIVTALKNPYLVILGHPTGRLINEREGYDANWNEVFKTAAEHGKVLEVSAQPMRLDLNDEHILAAKKLGCMFAVNTDSHSVSNLKLMRYGLGQARRGWLAKKDVLNTKSFKELRKFLDSYKARAQSAASRKSKAKTRVPKRLAM